MQSIVSKHREGAKDTDKVFMSLEKFARSLVSIKILGQSLASMSYRVHFHFDLLDFDKCFGVDCSAEAS